MNTSLELVVARYMENLLWIHEIPEPWRITVYDKSGNHGLPHLPLPNVGREAHTYLHHIITNWGELADYTAFVQGDPLAHCPNLFSFLKAYSTFPTTPPPFNPLGHYCECDANACPQHCGLPIGQHYSMLFGRNGRQTFRFVVGAQFIVSKEAIYRHPIEFYKRAMSWVDKDRGCTMTGNNAGLSWGAHILERLWSYMFDANAQ